jgi:hypothetical protein
MHPTKFRFIWESGFREDFLEINQSETRIVWPPCLLKGNFAIFYMLAKYVHGDIKYIFTKFYRHISTNNEANRKFVILISNFSTRL